MTLTEMYTGTDSTVKSRRWFREKRDSNNFWQPFQEIYTDGSQSVNFPGNMTVAGSINGTGPQQINWTSAAQNIGDSGSANPSATYTLSGLPASANSYAASLNVLYGGGGVLTGLLIGYGASYNFSTIFNGSTGLHINSFSLSNGVLTITIGNSNSTTAYNNVSVEVEGMIL